MPNELTNWLRLPPDKRISIYRETLAYQKGNPSLSIASVRRHIQNKYHFSVTYYSVHRWIRGEHDPRNWFNSPKYNSSLSYFLGATLSDGCCHANANRKCDRSIILSVKDYDFAQAFARAATQAFGKVDQCNIRFSQNRYVVKVNSVLFYNLISKGLDSFLPIVYKYPSSFIRGFFDGDGDATTSISKGRLKFCVRVTNSNMQYLRVLDRLLRQFFGISGHIRMAHSAGYKRVIAGRLALFRDPVYSLKIDGIDQLARFATTVGFEIVRKQQKLDDAIRLVRGHGSRVAAQHWLRLYDKKNGRWIKKTAVMDQSSV